MNVALRRKVAFDVGPRLTVVGSLERVRAEIVVSMPVHGGVSCTGVEVRRLNRRDPRTRRQALDVTHDVGPVLAAVLGHLNVSVVSANPYHARSNGRFGYSQDRAVKLGGGIVDDDRPARRLLFALVISGQIGTDRFPRVAVVRGLEQHVAAEVNRLGVLRRSHDGRIPIEAVLVTGDRVTRRPDLFRIRVNVSGRAAVRIGHGDVAALRVGVNDVRRVEIGNDEEAVSSADRVPIVFANAFPEKRRARTDPVAVVL